MAQHLTPEMMVAAYEFLRTTKPFRGWKLPHSDDVRFVVNEDAEAEGRYERLSSGEHVIYVSTRYVARPSRLVETMAHEMIHMRQALTGFDTALPNEEWHGDDFKRMAALVCKHHGYDRQVF